MREKREARITPYMRIVYPVFENESAPIQTQEMNAFYAALADAVEVYAAEIAGRRESGIRILTADYKTRAENDRIVVEYKLTVRRRGRTEAAKTLLHTWEEGMLLPVRKYGNPFPKVLRKVRGFLTVRKE